MPTVFWIWLALAAVFLIIELITPTLVFLSFVVGSVAGAILTVFYPEAVYWQIGLFLVVSAVLLPFMRKAAKKITVLDAPVSNVDRLIGLEGLVLKEITTDQNGRVKVEGEEWAATADEPIAATTRVVVKRVAGAKLHVEKK
jgi:membrane protein implicated in regulation of membrane protease activity